jgi:hypothetical protein
MSGDREDERPTGAGRATETGVSEKRCSEAQADGVPCDNVASACEECERAEVGESRVGGRGAA